MKKGYLLSVWILVVVVMLISSACSPSRISVDEYNKIHGIESSSQEQEAPPEDEPAAVEDQQPEEPEEPAEPESEFPEDVK